jgi:hypothetical protein
MKRIYNKFLIISTLAFIMGGAYLYFSNDLNSGDMVPVVYGSSLESSSSLDLAQANVSGDGKISSDISFLTTLLSLKNIKIDTSLFSNKLFNGLKDNSVKIEKVTAGRVNPFAPAGYDNVAVEVPLAKVVTDQPTQITDKTVMLNGTINANGASNSYFEYGVTEKLGSITGIVKQSLVGTFIKNVLGLTPKTSYFYRACADINKTVFCGEVVSFTTN